MTSARMAFLALFTTLLILPAGSKTYVCKVPVERTRATSAKIHQLRGLTAERDRLPLKTDADLDRYCMGRGMELLKAELRLAKEILAALPGLECPTPIIQEYRTTVKNTAEQISLCLKVRSSSRRTVQPARCITPAPGHVSQRKPSMTCLRVTNTNSDSKCVYYFSYLVVTNRKTYRNGGGRVEPGKTEERCTQIPGADIRFDKWTRSAGSGR